MPAASEFDAYRASQLKAYKHQSPRKPASRPRKQIAQHAAQHLAGGRTRQGLDDADFRGPLKPPEALAVVRLPRRPPRPLRPHPPALRDHKRPRALAPTLVRPT